MNELYDKVENLYASVERPWGTVPLPFVAAAVEAISSGTVLDLGSGDGRHSLYLAERGFDVTAVDLSESAIIKLQEYAKVAGLSGRITGISADLGSFAPGGQYDLVLCNSVLHFLDDRSFLHVIECIRSATKSGGLVIISDITKTGPVYREGDERHWLEEGELKGLFAGWELINYWEGEMEMKRMKDAEGNFLRQVGSELVARKQ